MHMICSPIIAIKNETICKIKDRGTMLFVIQVHTQGDRGQGGQSNPFFLVFHFKKLHIFSFPHLRFETLGQGANSYYIH